ncbi:hypothetical protein AMATHDRAFT_87414 [Amanita thiersii Skay4041]|uniref:Fungal-type protein kinase domain-containing protein n=1 Tax=Amanita thiersii Skay4041 TaxID=703135 RepID=A0A2A9NJV2_9AGAR|nr:hypothetical protein AMATHDRAFT_87414 [Amanita thiersii Skay4041]
MTTRVKAEDLHGYVDKELRDVRLCSKNDFVHLLSPPSEEQSSWDTVINKVIESHYNNSTKRWKDFPSEKANEIEYYKPLVDLANKVCQECQSVRKHQDALDGQWVDTHSISPQERSDSKSRIQPDIVHVAFPEPFEEVTKHINNMDDVDPDDEDTKINIQFFWQQIHVLVEVKKSEPKDLSNHILQLCSYMRQMFQEQLDRRFIISMLLCGDQLYLWLLDRAGLVGTWDRFNIHVETRLLIQILAAISLLPAQKLGWDPTMRLYVDRDIIPSYRLLEAKRCRPQSNLFHDNWVISMPAENGVREDFLTIRLIDGAGAQMLCSRATLVWEVIKLSALPKFDGSEGGGSDDIEKEIYVLKQMWQQVNGQSTFPDEAGMYNHAKRGNFIYSAEFVRVDGDLSSTSSLRKPLNYRDFNEDEEENEEFRDEHLEPLHDMATLTPLTSLLYRCSANAVARAQTRMMMTGTGYPLRYSVSCLELVSVLRDCVNVHKQMFLYGVLHRDISLGNILISGNGLGQLIDLDHAKHTDSTKQLFPNEVSSSDVVSFQQFIKYANFDADILQFSLQYFGHQDAASCYMRSALNCRFPEPDNQGRVFGCEDFGWPSEKQREEYKKLPNFAVKEPREGYLRTGTVRYMSYQVLLMDPTPPNEIFIHEPYHDIESFFWVLVYICIACQGPGGNLNLDLKRRNSRLSKLVNKAFNPKPDNLQALGFIRRDYIRDRNDQFKELMTYLHKDFDDLRNLIKRWWKILAISCSNAGPDRDLIHHHVLQLLDETVSQLTAKRTPAEKEKEEAEKEQRRKRWASKRRFPPTGIASRTRSKCWI